MVPIVERIPRLEQVEQSCAKLHRRAEHHQEMLDLHTLRLDVLQNHLDILSVRLNLREPAEAPATPPCSLCCEACVFCAPR